MSPTIQRACVWCGAGLMVLFTVGLLIAGFLPPPPPGMTAEQVKQLYIEDKVRIRCGILICFLGAVLLLPWVAVISAQLRRLEDGRVGILAWIQLTAGSLGAMVFVLPAMGWQTAAYRPEERSAELTQALHDLATLTFVATPTLGAVQNFVIAIAIFRDRRSAPLFPRWVGYFNIWSALMFLPAVIAVFFHSGPFAWDGVITWWVGLSAFGAWFGVMIVFLLRAIRDEETTTAMSSTVAASEA